MHGSGTVAHLLLAAVRLYGATPLRDVTAPLGQATLTTRPFPSPVLFVQAKKLLRNRIGKGRITVGKIVEAHWLYTEGRVLYQPRIKEILNDLVYSAHSINQLKGTYKDNNGGGA
jgi:hypothetical protein